MSDDTKDSKNKKRNEIEEIKSEDEIESITKEEMESCILQLRKILEEDNKLKYLKCEDAYLERFLVAKEYNVQETFKMIQRYYEVLEENPTWFTNENPMDKKWMIERNTRILLKDRDKKGKPIYIVKLGNTEPSKMDLKKDIIPVDQFFGETMFIKNIELTKGLCVIIDISNFPYSMIKWLTPHTITTILKMLYSFPIKLYEFHIVNSSTWIKICIKIIWPFLSQQMKEQIRFHFNNLVALQTYIDKDVLPEEYGGLRKIVPSELHQVVFDINSEIVNNFRLHRTVYLENIKSNNTY